MIDLPQSVLQKKDCRQSRGYATTNINSDESFLPINDSISPSKTPDEGIITSFLKVSQINTNSFEEFEFGRPDDFCYLINEEVKFTNTPGNLQLEFAYSGTDCLSYEVVFKITEIFVIIPSKTDIQKKVSLVRFNRDEVILNPEIIHLIKSVSQNQSQQAGSTLLHFCQKISSSNGIHIRSIFCKSGELYKNWLLKESDVDFTGKAPEYLDYNEAVQAYELYIGTEKAELSEYLKRPKIGNTYKFRLVFTESLQLKRLKLIKTISGNIKTDVTLLSATFSDLLLKTFDSPLIIERCHNVDVINEWKSLFTCFMDEERFYSLFSPLRLPTGEEEEESFEALTNSSSRWFYTVE